MCVVNRTNKSTKAPYVAPGARNAAVVATPAAANRRYICVEGSLSLMDMAAALRPGFPDAKLPPRQLPKLLMYVAGPLAAGGTRKKRGKPSWLKT